MNGTIWVRWLNSLSDNQKSKIENPKWWGIFAIVFIFTFGAVAAQAQQLKKVPRIGYLSALDPAAETIRAETIRLALRERGYIEGQSITIEYRYTQGKVDRAPELAAELVRLEVDIIVVAGGTLGFGRPRMQPKRFPLLWWVLGSIQLVQA